jgi:hypothetical protein
MLIRMGRARRLRAGVKQCKSIAKRRGWRCNDDASVSGSARLLMFSAAESRLPVQRLIPGAQVKYRLEGSGGESVVIATCRGLMTLLRLRPASSVCGETLITVLLREVTLGREADIAAEWYRSQRAHCVPERVTWEGFHAGESDIPSIWSAQRVYKAHPALLS